MYVQTTPSLPSPGQGEELAACTGQGAFPQIPSRSAGCLNPPPDQGKEQGGGCLASAPATPTAGPRYLGLLSFDTSRLAARGAKFFEKRRCSRPSCLVARLVEAAAHQFDAQEQKISLDHIRPAVMMDFIKPSRVVAFLHHSTIHRQLSWQSQHL